MRKLYSSIILTVAICLSSFNEAKATVYYYMGGGAAVTLLTSWSTSSTSAGVGVPSTFTGNHTWNFFNAGSLSLSATWSVSSGAIVNFGDGTNGLNFTMASGAILGVNLSQTAPKIVVANTCTVTLNTGIGNWNQSIAKTIFNTGSTIIYDTGSSLQQFQSSYYNLMINTAINTNGIPVSVSNDLTLNAPFDLAFATVSVTRNVTLNANLVLDGGILSIGGQLLGSSSFVGDATGSSITLNGTGNIGTLNFQAGSTLISSLTVSLTSGSVTLGSDLSIDGTNGGALTLTSGTLNLNGHTLSVDNSASADLGSSIISGSSSSLLLFTNVNTLTGSLTMDAAANTLKALYLNSIGQTLTLGNALNITDSITVENGIIASGGNLTLKSTELLKGRVGTMGPTGSITGNVTVETFAKGPTTGWAQLGAAGVTGQTVGSWDGKFPITCYGCAYTPDDVSGFYSVQGWDETGAVCGCSDGYNINITSTTPVDPGTGFWVYLGASASGAGDITYPSTGALVQGLVSVPVTRTSGAIVDEGFNLIANPYASPISWDQLWNDNVPFNFNSALMYIYNVETNASETFDASLGANYIIPAGQGFFIEAFNDFTMSFTENMKRPMNTAANPLTKTVAQASQLSGFLLKIKGSNGDADKTTIRFNANATAGYDRLYDGHKMFSTPGYIGTNPVYSKYTSISTKLQNEYYTQNTLPALTQNMNVPVLVKVSASGTYSISATDVTNYDGCTIIKDNVTGQYHDLSVAPYVCTINDTTSTPRFELVLCKTAVETSVKELNAGAGNIQVFQDEQGPLVATFFTENTKATISVYNVVGQQLIKDLVVEGTETKTHLNIDSHNEVLLIRVSTDKQTVTKKIITH